MTQSTVSAFTKAGKAYLMVCLDDLDLTPEENAKIYAYIKGEVTQIDVGTEPVKNEALEQNLSDIIFNVRLLFNSLLLFHRSGKISTQLPFRLMDTLPKESKPLALPSFIK